MDLREQRRKDQIDRANRDSHGSVITGRNVNDIFPRAVLRVQDRGIQVSPRGERTLEFPTPVMTIYQNPLERVLFSEVRDANPFFHLFEAFWILAGRNDVEFVAQFNKNIAQFSDNGVYFHGAYGYRLRQWVNGDQVAEAIELLKADHATRQVVLQIWDSKNDLGTKTKDCPCNDLIFLKVRDGALNMTVCCRSNDIVWGCYGANVVHFSILQEYIAALVGVRVGYYTQVSDSWHAYVDRKDWEPLVKWAEDELVKYPSDPYTKGTVKPMPLVDEPGCFDHCLKAWMDDPIMADVRNKFFWHVARPMYQAWYHHKEDRTGAEFLQACLEETPQGEPANDWLCASFEWMKRREWK